VKWGAGFVVAALLAFWLPQWYLAWSPSASMERSLSESEAAAALAHIRAALVGAPIPPVPATPLSGPVVVSLWIDGESRGRASSGAPDLAAAATQLADRLTPRPDAATLARAQLKLDMVTARSALPAALAGITVRPGIDGILVGGETLITPDELLVAGLSPAVALPDLDLRFGIDRAALGRFVARHASGRLERARVAQFIEPGLRVEHGHAVTTPVVDAAALRRAALDGGDYLSGHLDGAGRFDYLYYVGVDQAYHEEEDAALTRHAGSTWFLASLGEDHRTATDRALGYLSTAHVSGLDPVSAPEADRAGLGASALALAALSERQLQAAPLDPALSAWADRLTAHLLAMQRADGDFHHVFSVADRRPDPVPRLPYYSGEAAFGLAKRWHVTAPAARPPITDALERAIAFLIGLNHRRTFVLDFIFLEDHWTCLAADSAWEALRPSTREAAASYCEAFAAFLGRAQYPALESGDALTSAQPDLAGAYGFSSLLPPHPTPVGSRTEALLATLSMAERRGAPAEVLARLRSAIGLGLGFLLRHQLGHAPPDDRQRQPDDYLLAAPRRAKGGFLFSDEDRVIRIDFVQHAGAALWRASRMAPPL